MKDPKLLGAQPPMDAGTTMEKKAGAKLGRDIQAKIGQQLRAVYDDVVNQGVPDRFADLLTRLDKPQDKESR